MSYSLACACITKKIGQYSKRNFIILFYIYIILIVVLYMYKYYKYNRL